jgi:antitoxin component YwqK of YwqJK toxin-antitoxin module
MKQLIVICFLIIGLSILNAQTLNQFNESGQRDGVWKKYFNGTKVLRYEGTFVNGKEVGLFKFYKNIKGVSVLSATRLFNDSTNLAQVRFFTSKGKVISEGNMRHKTYVGTWKYYQKDSDKLLILEHYNTEGNLSGLRYVYYNNGQIAEETNYSNGLLDGNAVYYSKKGVTLKTLTYKNNELDGVAKFYDPKGNLLAEGYYRKGKKHGVWSYYENAKIKETKDFTVKGKYKPKKKSP